jgi:hypothetical protein
MTVKQQGGAVPTQFDFGALVGLLVGEGHFGGDGRQPQVTLRMHVRHEAIFRWLERTFPGGRVYGPYHHGGRHYLQWMARGPFLRDELVPLLDGFLSPSLDRHSFERYQLMKAHYPQLAGQTTPSARASDRAASALSSPTAGNGDNRGTAAKSAPSAVSAGDPATFDEVFTELRETWPS